MNISINKMVTLSYTLREGDVKGEIIEQTPAEQPLQFVFGLGTMLPMFESNLAGLEKDQAFEMNIKAKDAYGEIDEDAIVDLSKDIFVIDGVFDEQRFSVGSQIPMQSSNGQRLNGRVITVDDSTLTMDFNHPLAGVDLHFEGKILEVREATPEELAPSMGCGCGSGGCGSGSCDTDDHHHEHNHAGSGCGSGSCGC
jgi:FKBP-type peptidyl-prolyl cis-trans isomerase SlyD